MTTGKAEKQAGEHGDRWRVVVFILGLIAVGGAVALWLLPASPAVTNAVDKTATAVTDGAGHKSNTKVIRNTTTTVSGVGRSDAMLVGILTFGAALLVVAGFWNRIQEFTFGGISIRLTEAATETPEIALVSTVAPSVNDTSVGELAVKVDAISKRGLRFLRVDLQTGDKWPYTNLSVFMLLLAKRSRVEVVIFIGQGGAGPPETYLGAASVPRLADRIAAEDPDLSAAYRFAETAGSSPGYTAWASSLLAELGRRDPRRAPYQPNPPPDWVDVTRLDELAGPALIHDRVEYVEYKGEQTLSKKQQSAILRFPLSFVPITVPVTGFDYLAEVVDKRWLAEEIALRTVGF
jgi:hypothetical protein